MKFVKFNITLILVILATSLLDISFNQVSARNASQNNKTKILVVDSYHKDYHWSQQTQQGFCDAMLELGYFDNQDQVAHYKKNDLVKTSSSIIKTLWMDSKKRTKKAERQLISKKIFQQAIEFNPDIIYLGDDNAARFIGGKFLDSAIPIVFWGVNFTPVKWGLVDSVKQPGHNVTGVFQSGYYAESLILLKKLAPHIKTFAILSDQTPSGRSHYKAIEYLVRKGDIKLNLIKTIATDQFEEWKSLALSLQNKVDAFFIAQYSGLKDVHGKYVSPQNVADWYTANIQIPEAATFKNFVKHGLLCAADDSGYNQGYKAVEIGHDILVNNVSPATYSPQSPGRGPLFVNKQRASALGINLDGQKDIEIIQ